MKTVKDIIQDKGLKGLYGLLTEDALQKLEEAMKAYAEQAIDRTVREFIKEYAEPMRGDDLDFKAIGMKVKQELK